jgi:hypothetical protein
MRSTLLSLSLVSVIAFGGCEGDKATNQGDATPPATVTDLEATACGHDSAELTWSVPGDDGCEGNASGYDIRYSDVPADSVGWWDSIAVAVVEPPIPSNAGERDSVRVGPLLADHVYHFAIRTADEVPNWSEVSNVATCATGAAPDTIPPAAIVDLAVVTTGAAGITLSWTAPGDDEHTGIAAHYDVRYATSEITGQDWDAALQVEGEPVPQVAGSFESLQV